MRQGIPRLRMEEIKDRKSLAPDNILSFIENRILEDISLSTIKTDKVLLIKLQRAIVFKTLPQCLRCWRCYPDLITVYYMD